MTNNDLAKIKNKWVERLAYRGKSRAIIRQWRINIRFGKDNELTIKGERVYAVCIPDPTIMQGEIIVRSIKSDFYKKNPCPMDLIVLHELLHLLLVEFDDRQDLVTQRAEAVIDEISRALYEGYEGKKDG